jgi:maltokinase-like protein
MAEIGLAGIDERALAEHIVGQRWYASKTRDVANVRIVDEVPLRMAEPPLLSVALAEVRFHPGTHETYQLLLGARPADEGWQDCVVGDVGGLTVYDALADNTLTYALVDLMRGDTLLESPEGQIELRPAGTARAAGGLERAVELVGHLRRRADPQALSTARGRHQSRAGAPPLPHEHGLSQHRRPRRLVRVHGSPARRHTGRAAAIHRGR